MSRSEPSGASSPAIRFFEWKAEKGDFQYYDKEKKENIQVKLPFTFLVLDEVSQIGGGTKVNGKFEGYWSNAVKNLNSQILTVKSKQGIVAQGLYADLKERKGLHYVKGLYIGFYDENKTLQIGYIKFQGSSLGAWFEFAKLHRDICKGAFTIKSRSEVIHGDKGDYYTPVFVYKTEVTEDTETAAVELDKTVQAYLKAYFSQNGGEEEYTGTQVQAATAGGGDQEVIEAEPVLDDDIPF